MQPRNRTARNADEALVLAREIGYPLVVRPSYVLGGRAMEVVYSDADLTRYIRDAVRVSERSPVLLDRFLDNAIEVDVDVVADADGNVLVGGIMEHIEEAGVHSGDSSCSLPPYSLSPAVQAQLRTQVMQLARALKVNGLMNTQFAVQGETI
ncbi:carbamoyl phosphate synthase large subunit, partial [mine drainage metagenome]